MVAFAHGVAIHEYVRLLWRNMHFQLPILREAGSRSQRDGYHEGEEVNKSSHLYFS
jgi:hypothetical protein